jgi:hypothetical protein
VIRGVALTQHLQRDVGLVRGGPETVGLIFDEINEKYGTDAQPIVKR